MVGSLLPTARVDPTDLRVYDNPLPIFNAETGDLLIRQPTPGVLRLRRSAFRRLIAEGLHIQYGKRVISVAQIDGAAIATFEDGTQESGNILIGCDGAKSRVREALFGSPKGSLQELPLACCSTCGTLPKEISKELLALDRTYCVSYHPEGFVAFLSLHALTDIKRPEIWQWILILTWRHPQNESLPDTTAARAWWAECANKLAEPFKAAFEAAPNITLAGDAAHPMTFHRGQGLSNAIADAAKLCAALNDHVHGGQPLDQALGTYESEVVERGQKAVLSSYENSMMVMDWERVRESAMFRRGIGRDGG
ncbi:hypothetical protein ACLMJK_009424 [Lecanora helva]